MQAPLHALASLQTLDLFAQLCRERQYPFVKLDGKTSVSKRQKLVQQFNDRSLVSTLPQALALLQAADRANHCGC